MGRELRVPLALRRPLIAFAVAALIGGCMSPTPTAPQPTATAAQSSSGQPSPSGGLTTPGQATPTGTLVPPQGQAEHVVAIRTVGERSEFYDRLTGQGFVPRGTNYVYVPQANGTVTVFLLKVGVYDPARTRSDFALIAAAGMNTVRVFLDHCSVGPGCITSETGTGLNQAYLDNVADMMAAARETGLQVLFTSVDLPDGGGYATEANTGSNTSFAPYRNSYYLTAAAVTATRRYWTDLLNGLRDRHAAFDAVLGWELVNEEWMFKDQPPLSLTSGMVTSATGTYDMADPLAKARMVSDGLISYISDVRNSILAIDPTALVTMGFFVPEIAAPDWYVETAPLLGGSDLDFLDFHAYPGGATVARHAELFGMEGYTAKPIIMGEFGAFRHQYADITSGGRALTNWVADSCAAGWDGWLYWAYYPADPAAGDRTWGLTDAAGFLMDVLSPQSQPDPCVAVEVPGSNLAFGKEVRSSGSLSGAGPEGAFDENIATIWNSGNGPPQWIQVDLGAAHEVTRISLIVGQDPAGGTVHRVLVRSADGSGFRVVKTFDGRTVDGQELVFEPPGGLANVRYIRIETTSSPSWVAWKEIQVFGQ